MTKVLDLAGAATHRPAKEKHSMDTGLIGGIAGGTLGLIGGSIGTYFSIKNTRGPRARASMIKWSIFIWIGVGLFLGLTFTLPAPYRHFLWIPYAIFLPVGIAALNREQTKIKKMESQESWRASGDKPSV